MRYRNSDRARPYSPRALSIRESSTAKCPNTKLTIPECSCAKCLEDQVRRAAPALLERDVRAAGAPDSPAGMHETRRAA